MGVSEKASVASRKAPRRIIFKFVTYCVTCVTKKRNQNRGSQMNSPTLPQKNYKFFATSPVPIRRSGQTSTVIGPRIAANYGL